MRIALFHNVSPGGARRVVYEQAKYLSKKNIVDLYYIRDNQKDFLDFSKLKCKPFTYKFAIDSSKYRLFKRIKQDLKTFVSLRTLHWKIATDINSKKYDCIIIHPDRYTQAPHVLRYINTKKIYFCEEALRMAYEKELAFSDNIFFLKRWYENITRYYRKKMDAENVRFADLILANSEFSRKQIEKAYQLKAYTCHLGVDINVFKPKTNSKKKIILFVGAKEEFTGFNILKKALNNLPDKSFVLQTVDYAQQKHIISDKALSKYYSSAKVVMCLGYKEPFGLTALEAQACEVPVIALNEGGYTETVIHGKTGYLVSRNIDEIAQKIELLLNNSSLAKKIGKAGRENVVHHWTWELHGKRLALYIKKIL